MSYPGPPGGPGNAGPYGQQPQQGPWSQGQGMAPPPPMPPAPQNAPLGAQDPWAAPQGAQGTWAPQGGPGAWAPQGGPGMPGMPPVGMPAPAPRKNTGRSCLTAALAVIGAFALLGGGGLIAHAYSNHSQTIDNRSNYGPSMWRNESAAKLFPETLGAKHGPNGKTTDRKSAQWHRLGISDKTGCDDGLSGGTAEEAKKLGCTAVLRATYIDPTGNTVATVALIVLPKGDTAKNEISGFFSDDQFEHPLDDGVKAYDVPGTAAARWSDALRNGSAGASVTSMDLPYALAASAGAVDGRKAGKLPGAWGSHRSDAKEDRGAWQGAASSLVDTLNTHLGDLLMEETS